MPLKSFKRVLLLFIFLLIWELLPLSGVISKAFLAPPSEVFVAIIKLLISGELLEHTSISLQRALTGFSLAAIIMIPLGFLMGWYKGFEEIADGLVQTLRQTSSLSLFPVFILFLGIGEISKIAVIFWGAQWPILLNTISGVKSVDPLLIMRKGWRKHVPIQKNMITARRQDAGSLRQELIESFFFRFHFFYPV